jgi:hypothetical protein
MKTLKFVCESASGAVDVSNKLKKKSFEYRQHTEEHELTKLWTQSSVVADVVAAQAFMIFMK